MLNLATGETISGIAGSATAITYTITGFELVSGVESYKVLAQGQLGASAGTLYTAPSSTQSFVKSLHLVNATGADVSGIKLYKNGTSAINQLTGSMTIPANGWATYEEDGWRVYNASGERLMNGVTASGGGGGGQSAIALYSYAFDTSTTDSAPGAGKFRYSISTLNVSTLTMYIDCVDGNGNDITTFLDSLPLSTQRQVTLVRIYSTLNTLNGANTAKLISRTNGVGYRKLVLQWLNFRDVAPANTTAHTIQFEVRGGSLSMGQVNVKVESNDSRFTGIPGFIPNKIKVKTLTQNRAYVYFFSTDVALFLVQHASHVASAASTGGNRRVMICEVTDMRVDGFVGGKLWSDTGLQSGQLTTLGPKLITPSQVILPPGQFALIDAIGAFTGTLQMTCLNGWFKEGAGIGFNNGSSTTHWEYNSETYISADLTGSPSDPFGAMSLSSTAAAMVTTAGGDQFDVTTTMRYARLP